MRGLAVRWMGRPSVRGVCHQAIKNALPEDEHVVKRQEGAQITIVPGKPVTYVTHSLTAMALVGWSADLH